MVAKLCFAILLAGVCRDGRPLRETARYAMLSLITAVNGFAKPPAADAATGVASIGVCPRVTNVTPDTVYAMAMVPPPVAG